MTAEEVEDFSREHALFRQLIDDRYRSSPSPGSRPRVRERLDLDVSVRLSLLVYPQICMSKGDALHHMYFVGGSGYDWAHGALLEFYTWPVATELGRLRDIWSFAEDEWGISSSYEDVYDVPMMKELKLYEEELKIRDLEELDGDDESDAILGRVWVEQRRAVSLERDISNLWMQLRARDNLGALMQDIGLRYDRESPYPLPDRTDHCNYGIYALPPDVKDDYLQGGIDAIWGYYQASPHPMLEQLLEQCLQVYQSRGLWPSL